MWVFSVKLRSRRKTSRSQSVQTKAKCRAARCGRSFLRRPSTKAGHLFPSFHRCALPSVVLQCSMLSGLLCRKCHCSEKVKANNATRRHSSTSRWKFSARTSAAFAFSLTPTPMSRFRYQAENLILLVHILVFPPCIAVRAEPHLGAGAAD